MTRRIRSRHHVKARGNIAMLECGHEVCIPDWAILVKLNALFCDRCHEASKLPNTVKEIAEIHWHGAKY